MPTVTVSTDKDGNRYWIFMWKRGGKRRVMGLGSERTVTLAQARKKAKAAARKVDDGIDRLTSARKAARPCSPLVKPLRNATPR